MERIEIVNRNGYGMYTKIDSIIKHKNALNDLKREFDSGFLFLSMGMNPDYDKFNKVNRKNEKKVTMLYAQSSKILNDLEMLQQQKVTMSRVPSISGNSLSLSIIDIERDIIKGEIDRNIEKLSEQYYKSLDSLIKCMKNSRPRVSLIKGRQLGNINKSFEEKRKKADEAITKMCTYLGIFTEKKPLMNWAVCESKKSFTERVEDISDKRGEVDKSINLQEKELESFLRDVHELSYQIAVTDKSLIPAGMSKEVRTIKRKVNPRTISALKSTLEKLRKSDKTQIELEEAKNVLSNNSVYFADRKIKLLEKMINDFTNRINKVYQIHSRSNFDIRTEKLNEYGNIEHLAEAAKSFDMTLKNNERIADDQKNISRGTHVVQGDNTNLEFRISELQTRANQLRQKGEANSDLYNSIIHEITQARRIIDGNKKTIETKSQAEIKSIIPDVYSDLDKKYSDGTSGGMKM